MIIICYVVGVAKKKESSCFTGWYSGSHCVTGWRKENEEREQWILYIIAERRYYNYNSIIIIAFGLVSRIPEGLEYVRLL